MDIRKVKKLIEMLEESQLNEIEIKEGEESVKLVKAISALVQEQIVTSNAVAPAPQPAVVNDNVSAESDTSQSTKEETISGQTIDSPMVGTFYAAPNPGAKDFVTVGDKISEGDVLCIIEAMKMMNEIKSDFSGKIVSIDVEDGQPVEYGQNIITIN